MSDSENEQGGAAGALSACSHEIVGSELLCMARGFACVFWGLLLSLILLFSNAFFEFFDIIRIPAYLIGSGIVAWGLFSMRDAGSVSRLWTRRRRGALFFAILHIYCAPFFVWWSAMQSNSFLLVNFLGFVLVGMFALLYINLLAAEIARCLKSKGEWAEACLFAAGIVMLMIAPFVISIAGPAASAVRFRTSLYFELWSLANRAPTWVRVLVSLPCSLTLVAAWKAKSLCYRRFLAD